MQITSILQEEEMNAKGIDFLIDVIVEHSADEITSLKIRILQKSNPADAVILDATKTRMWEWLPDTDNLLAVGAVLGNCLRGALRNLTIQVIGDCLKKKSTQEAIDCLKHQAPNIRGEIFKALLVCTGTAGSNNSDRE